MADAYEGLTLFDKAMKCFLKTSELCAEAEKYDHEDKDLKSHIEERVAEVNLKEEAKIDEEKVESEKGGIIKTAR